MPQNVSRSSVVVGIDGSRSALRAGLWAVDEATTRDVPLRLIHVVQSTAFDTEQEVSDGEAALRAVEYAIGQTGRDVKVDSDVVHGPVVETLVEQSADASMICLGSASSALQAAKFVGATASAVAAAASCPVAVIRTTDDGASPSPPDVAVIVDDPLDLEAVLDAGVREATLRHARLLVLNLTTARLHELLPEDVDRRVADFLHGHPDVRHRSLMTPTDVAAFLAELDTPLRLVVVARGDAGTRLLGNYGRFMLRATDCSVLLLPPRQ
jgi:nucleotide-binding universal stress UspA family protein